MSVVLVVVLLFVLINLLAIYGKDTKARLQRETGVVDKGSVEENHIHSWQTLYLIDLTKKEATEEVLACQECGYIASKNKYLTPERLKEFQNKLALKKLAAEIRKKRIEQLVNEHNISSEVVESIFKTGEDYVIKYYAAEILPLDKAKEELSK